MEAEIEKTVTLIQTLQAFSEIEGIEVEPALKRLRGLQNILETSARATGASLRGRLEKMALYLENGMYEDFSIAIHGLKGSLATIGAVTFSEAAAVLERAVKSGDTSYCEEHFRDFAENIEELGRKMTEIFGG